MLSAGWEERKPLTQLYVKGHFTEGVNGKKNSKGTVTKCTPMWKKHKKSKTKELNVSGRKGNLQLTENGRNAEITVDLALQARAKLGENKVNGPEDAIVSEMSRGCPRRRFTHKRSIFRNVFWVRWSLQAHGRW